MKPAAEPLCSGTFIKPGVGAYYFATEAHYASLASRVIAASRSGSFLLVTGDPPASPDILSRALSSASGSRHAITNIRCGSELNPDELSATAVIAALPASGGATEEPKSALIASPLFVFDNVDRLSDEQIKEICETTRLRDGTIATGVLLARPAFLARLEKPALGFLKERLAAQFCLQEVGRDEGLAYLRHQLAQVQCHPEAHRLPVGILLGFAAFVVAAMASIGAFLLMHPTAEKITEEPASAGTTTSSTRQAPTPPGKGEATSAVAPQAALAAEQEPTFPAALSPLVTTAPLVEAPEATWPRSPPGPRLSAAEIAALLTRGDAFLGAGDIASARLFYMRAAEARDGQGAFRLAATFDPAFVGRAGVNAMFVDPGQALSWYRRARDLGEAAAERRLKSLEPRPPAEPDAREH